MELVKAVFGSLVGFIYFLIDETKNVMSFFRLESNLTRDYFFEHWVESYSFYNDTWLSREIKNASESLNHRDLEYSA